MKTKTAIALACIAMSFILFSCNRGNEEAKQDAVAGDISDLTKNIEAEQKQIPTPAAPPAITDSARQASPTAVLPHVDWDSKIIKNATLKVEITDFKKYNNYVHAAVKQYGAYVAQEEQTSSEEKTETSITIKVPVAQFEPMMNALPTDEGKVMEKKISTEDVTGQVVDTKSRLESKKQMRLKYLEFLKESKNMAEVLQVQNEIDGIQEQIEAAAGRISYLTQQTAFSTINLTFYQPTAGFTPSPDKAPGFLDRIGAAFKTGASWIGDLLVGLISVWPLVLAALAILMGWKAVRRKKIMVQNP